jgi:hypothetical protein
MKTTRLIALSVVLTVASGMAIAVDTNALLACRTLAVDAERLACYDTLMDDQALKIESANAGAVAATSQPLPAPRQKQSAGEFGLESKIASETEIASIVSRIVGEFRGWEANSRITLENGQVWQIADKSRGVYVLENPVVTIERGALGTFNMLIEGANRSPKVKRLK